MSNHRVDTYKHNIQYINILNTYTPDMFIQGNKYTYNTKKDTNSWEFV